MSTIYTFNSKVLKNTANDKWLIKKPADEVQIGNQIWKIKNLAIDDGQGGIYTQTVNYGQGDVVEYYYTWAAALRVAASISGWHLPTGAEWDTLATTIGTLYTAGTKLKSTFGWKNNGNGTDDYGFAAFPAGYAAWNRFYESSEHAWFWTSNEGVSTSRANYRRFNYTDAYMTRNSEDKTYGLSVRLIKD